MPVAPQTVFPSWPAGKPVKPQEQARAHRPAETPKSQSLAGAFNSSSELQAKAKPILPKNQIAPGQIYTSAVSQIPEMQIKRFQPQVPQHPRAQRPLSTRSSRQAVRPFGKFQQTKISQSVLAKSSEKQIRTAERP